ncbi:hypothetical protein HDU99_004300, partial [Rhizoclosmatium hyalinum]
MAKNDVAQIKSSVNGFNNALTKGLAEISNLSVKIMLTDTYGLYSYMAREEVAQSFFPKLFNTCFDGVKSICPVAEQKDYFFFDDSHITEKAASYWAQYAFNQVTGVKGYFGQGTAESKVYDALTTPSKDIKTIVAFGGGMSDNGKFYNRYNQTYPPPPYAAGRYSNGPVWVEQLATLMNNAALFDYASIGSCADVANAKA